MELKEFKQWWNKVFKECFKILIQIPIIHQMKKSWVRVNQPWAKIEKLWGESKSQDKEIASQVSYQKLVEKMVSSNKVPISITIILEGKG